MKSCEFIRIKEAQLICEKNPLIEDFNSCYSKVREHVKSCLDNLSKHVGYKGKNIEYEIIDVDFNESIKKLDGECFFIQFTSDGYVVVVGAGNDYGLPQSDRYLNVRILKCLKKQWSEKAILVFVKGLRPVSGHSGTGMDDNCEHLLQCRNGVEMYIGEYLLEKNVPIINFYSHKNYNYSKEKWKEIVDSIMSEK